MKHTNNLFLVSVVASIALLSGCGSDSSNGGVPSVSYGLPVTSSGIAYTDFNGSVIMNMELSKDGGTLYAAVNDSGSGAASGAAEHGLTILDLASGTTEHIDTGLMGRYVKLSKDETTAYVTAGGDQNLSFIDLGTKTVTDSIYIDSYASGMAITADGSKMYIGLDGVSGELAIVDIASKTIDKKVVLNGGYGNTVILSADETKAYISESSGGGLVTYNIGADTVDTIPTTNTNAADFDMTADEATAYVSLGNNNLGIDVVSMADNNITTTIYDINATDTFDWVREVKLSNDDKLLFVTEKNHNDMLFIVDLENNNSVSYVVNTSATSCIGPSSLEVSPNGSKVYVGCAEGVIVEYALTAQ